MFYCTRRLNLTTTVISGYAHIPQAVDSLKARVLMFLEKPYRSQELWETIVQAIEVSQRNSQKRSLQQDVRAAQIKPAVEAANVLRELQIVPLSRRLRPNTNWPFEQLIFVVKAFSKNSKSKRMSKERKSLSRR